MTRSIENTIIAALTDLCKAEGISDPKIVLEIPRQKDHGELSCNVAMTSAGKIGIMPRELAERLAAGFPVSPDGVEMVEVAGPGFLNFRLSTEYFHQLLKDIIADPSTFGSLDIDKSKRWLFEYVSANPTGPLNIVSARAASIGDTLVKVFNKRGFDAQSEYYVNDSGNQIKLLGESVKARYENTEIPEGGYHGEYIKDLAKKIFEDYQQSDSVLLRDPNNIGLRSANIILKEQEKILSHFEVEFDNWFSESELYKDKSTLKVSLKLQDKGFTYEKDGAVYFKSSSFGDNEDRVIETSDKRNTYIVPDTAYHINKHERGFIKAVTLLGPDHHSQSISMKAAMKALGLPDGFYHPIIVQQVNLKRDGVEVKMSKRAGIGITMEELIDEVGVDAARFFFLMRKITSHLDFDLEVAKRHTDDNPVYYVQYAHARVHQIFKMAESRGLDFDSEVDLSCLTSEEEIDLFRTMALFPWTLEAIIRGIDPQPLTVYLIELARCFHLFYSRHRVISDDWELTNARIKLCRGVGEVIKEGLQLMGVNAPEVM